MTLWLVRAGRYGEDEQKVLDNDIVAVGYPELPDLSRIRSREELKKLFEEKYPWKGKNAISNQSGQVWAFVKEIKESDLVALPLKKQAAIAIGVVKSGYLYDESLGSVAHHRKVEWKRKDIPRTKFDQDLLYSLGAYMTVCRIQRNNAEARVRAMLGDKATESPEPETDLPDLEELARDQIMKHIERKFKGHDLARLVESILKAQGYITLRSPPGPDGGADILAAAGPIGFESPRICVQVKSSSDPADVTVLMNLQGACQSLKAEYGLLVSWGGFKNSVPNEARRSFFTIRLWDASTLLDELLKNYEKLPEELKAELPLKRIWTLVPEEVDD